MNKYFILSFFLLFVPLVNAGQVIVQTPIDSVYSFSITNQYNSLNNQIILNTPMGEMSNINYVDSIRLYITRTKIPYPDSNLIVRIYKITNNGYGSYSYVDGYSINPSSIINDSQYFTISLSSNIYINSNESLAIGFYSQNAIGVWYLTGNINKDNYYVLPLKIPVPDFSIYQPYISNVNGNIITNNYGSSNVTVNFLPDIKYGSYKIPQTPNPTPTTIIPSDNGTLPCPDCNNSLPNITQTNNIPNVNFSNVSCPDCIGNETISNDKGLGTGTDSLLKDFGYCNTLGCNIQDLIDFLYDSSKFMFWLSFLLLIVKGYSVYRNR